MSFAKYKLTFKYILYDEIALRDHDEQRHVCPGEETELSHVVLLDQGQHEPHEAHAVQTEWDEAVVCHQELEVVLLRKGMFSWRFCLNS